MPARPTIQVFRRGDHYAARFSDPAVRDRLGSDTVAIPHASDADPLDVLCYVQERYPDASVTLAPTDTATLASRRRAFISVRSMN